MSSRRRNSKKNLGNSLSDIQRRLRRMERKPIRTRLQNRVIKGSAIAPGTITPEEVSFGTAVVTSDNPADVVDNPKEGLLVVDPNTNSASVYSEAQADYVTIQDAAAVAIAQGKSKTYVQNDEPTGGTYSLGDLWIDTNDGNKLYAYSGSAWVLKQDGAISTAQSTADGKNKVNYSTSDPGSTPNTAGDIWWKYASGIVIAQWTGAGGTSWTSNTIGNTVIASLDAGKITAGFLSVAGSVKIGTNPAGSGTSARVEIDSTGFYAYDGSVATVSITNTGAAIFSGTVNATAGAFTGYVTAGTARFGAGVQTGKNGIYVNSTNYWYDDGSFKAGTGTSTITYDGSGTLTIGAGSSIGGTTASTLVSNAAEGLTALQPGNGISDNASDQITSISTASGIVIGTRVDGTGARVEMNSGGFFAYDASGETVGITSAGAARFKGTITGSSFQSTNYASGNGIRIYESGSLDRIELDAASATKLSITANSSGAVIFGPSSLAYISMPNGGSVFISTNLSSGAQVTFASTGAVVNQTGYSAGAMSFRNILASTTPLTNGSAATGYLEGEIYLVY